MAAAIIEVGADMREFDTGIVTLDLDRVVAVERGEYFPYSGDYTAIAVTADGARIDTFYKYQTFMRVWRGKPRRWWQFWKARKSS